MAESPLQAPRDRASAAVTRLFLQLTPDRVIDAAEAAGLASTGLAYPLNSFENRVYEIELEDRSRVVAKFYRPGRWHREQILEEHSFLEALAGEEIPVCAPRAFPDGSTVAEIEGILYAVWGRQGGRAPDEMTDAATARLGRLVARIHNVAGSGNLPEISTRPALDADRYVRRPMAWMEAQELVPARVRDRYRETALAIADIYDHRLAGVARHRIHADLHLGNLLFRDEMLWLVDFDDMAVGPAVQDLWLAVPGRDPEALRQREILIAAYGELREFDEKTLELIEPLRGLRLVRYTGWLARRWHDPAFKAAWPHFGTADYWDEATEDLTAQLEVIRSVEPSRVSLRGSVVADRDDAVDASELTNKDYFWDWEG